MALLSWSKQYLIGNDIIDAEHIKLFALINNFHSRWTDTRDRHEISEIFRQLVAYAEMHFQHEEAIMEDAGYPSLAEHHRIHESMVDTIFVLNKSLMENDHYLEMDTMRFVRSWLLDHILQNDYLFRDYLKRKQKETAEPSPKPVDSGTDSAAVAASDSQNAQNLPDSPDTPNQTPTN